MADWPHSPPHRGLPCGACMVTAGTLYKRNIFDTVKKRNWLQNILLQSLHEFDFSVQAWAIMNNHYHVIVAGNDKDEAIGKAVAKIHGVSAQTVNKLDNAAGRRVWYQYWDTSLTYRTSYFARLHYVHENPVHHGVADRANDYQWCSARWLEQRADPAYQKLLYSFNIDNVNVFDAF